MPTCAGGFKNKIAAQDTICTHAVAIFDPSTNTWSNGTEHPAPGGTGSAVSGVFGTDILVCGGVEDGEAGKATDFYLDNSLTTPSSSMGEAAAHDGCDWYLQLCTPWPLCRRNAFMVHECPWLQDLPLPMAPLHLAYFYMQNRMIPAAHGTTPVEKQANIPLMRATGTQQPTTLGGQHPQCQ